MTRLKQLWEWLKRKAKAAIGGGGGGPPEPL